MSDAKLVIVVPREPVGKGRARSVPGRKRPITPGKTREWEERAAYFARTAVARARWTFTPSDRFEVEVRAFRKYLDKGPDLDNVVKAALDALNGIAYRDDAHVRRLVASVVQVPTGELPRLSISVWKLEDAA